MLSTMWPEKTACSLFRSRVRGQTSRLQQHGADPVQHFSVSMVTVDKHRDFSGALLKSGTNTISTPTTPLASSLAPSAVTEEGACRQRKEVAAATAAFVGQAKKKHRTQIPATFLLSTKDGGKEEARNV